MKTRKSGARRSPVPAALATAVLGIAVLGVAAVAIVSSPRFVAAFSPARHLTRQLAQQPQPVGKRRNVIIFVADGLRHDSVNAADTPALYQVQSEGVSFSNSHSLFPTFTTANASAMATGHYLGDTGDFSNAIYGGYPIFATRNFGQEPGTLTPFIENDPVQGDLDAHFGGNFLNEESLMAAARQHGFVTAAIGKTGPAAIQDVSQLNPVGGKFAVPQTIIIDDQTGTPDGVPLAPDVAGALLRAGLPLATPARQQPAGNNQTPGTMSSNSVQQEYFIGAATQAVLPLFKKSGKPFVMLYWSRDPDGSQHNQGDSLNSLVPGINGLTSLRGLRDADDNLRQILDAVAADRELAANTDIFVTSDHGFATVSRREIDPQGHFTTSYSAKWIYREPSGRQEVNTGFLPSGFLAIDVAHELGMPLFNPDSQITGPTGEKMYVPVDPTIPQERADRQQHPANRVGLIGSGDGLIGGTGRVLEKTDARVVIAANGGSDLVYLPNSAALPPVSGGNAGSASGRGALADEREVAGGRDKSAAGSGDAQQLALLRKIVAFLCRQDYVGGLFVNDRYGNLPGALPLSAIGLLGSAKTPAPAIVVAFKTFPSDPRNPLLSAVQIADTSLQEGQGMHGGFGRDSTFNFMAAMGPDFKKRFDDASPVSNADIAPTLARILQLDMKSHGKLKGRVLGESLAGGPRAIAYQRRAMASAKTESGKATVLLLQQAGEQVYFDRACLAEIRGAAPQCPY